MKNFQLKAVVALVSMIGLTAASAGNFSSNSPSGLAGSVVTYSISFAGDGVTTDASLRLDMPANITGLAVSATQPTNIGQSCFIVAGDILVLSPSAVIAPSGPTAYCNYDLTIAPAAPVGPIVLPLSADVSPNPECAGATAPPSCTESHQPVNVVVISPEFNFNPVPANPLVFSGLVSANIDQTITIQNIGDVGTTLNVSGAGLAAPFSVVSGLPAAIADGTNAVITLRCNDPVAQTTNQTLTLTTNDPDDGEGTVLVPVRCTTSLGPTAPTASLGAVVQPTAGPINLTAAGSVPVNIVSAGVATASLALTCTIPATGASNFQITGGGSRTINAAATVGNSAPDIGVSCVRQAAAVSATLSCAQNATPDPDPAALTAQINCPAGTVAPNGASSPAPGGTVNATAVSGTTAIGSMLFTNALPGGTAPYNLTNCTASTGFTVTSPSFPATIAPGGSQVLTVSCLAPAVGTSTAGTLSCTTTDPVFGNPTYVLSCNGISAVVPAIGNTGKILLASLVIGLGLLGMGLRRQA